MEVIHESNPLPRLALVAKSFANQHRIRILQLIHARPGLSLMEIATQCRLQPTTACEHMRRIELGRLVTKKRQGPMVAHFINARGQRVLDFLFAL
jgi:predicted transcriptional regulator